jgi:hypothetical protein
MNIPEKIFFVTAMVVLIFFISYFYRIKQVMSTVESLNKLIVTANYTYMRLYRYKISQNDRIKSAVEGGRE